MEGLVQIAEFFDSGTAEVERAVLESAGIPAIVFVDDLGRQGPARGRLMVPATAVEDACEVLDMKLPDEPMETPLDRNWGLVFGIVLAVALAGWVSLLLRI